MTIKREYYDSGQLSYETPYHRNKVHGMEKGWHKIGQLKYEIPYHQDKLHGIVKGWYENGQLEYEYYYLYNEEVTKEEWRKHELIVKLSNIEE